ncbi:hypothetical protein J3R82DRAFT_11995 [Butyriboletus roseoflavus]|nr:hypothetical protein J3R82DRAFT_11995 [Butyriboletus roseoflavus]
MTDTWTSPNHCAFMAFGVHLKHKDALLSMPLDIIEVTKVFLPLVDVLNEC